MLYLVIFLFVLFVFIILLEIKVEVEYKRDGRRDHIAVELSAAKGRLKHRFDIPLTDTGKYSLRLKRKAGRKEDKDDEDRKKTEARIREFYDRLNRFRCFLKKHNSIICRVREYLGRKVCVEKLQIDITIGTGDAFYTGMAAGGIWSAVGGITAYILNNFKVVKTKLNVRPDFMEKKLNIDLYCIFSIKVAHIIVVGFKILLYYLKINLK